MQRKGRTGHAQFRVVVQDRRFHPTSGRVVAYVGNYDPHTKIAKLDGEKISKYLDSGAQPSDRVAKLLSKEGIKLPDWFQASAPKKGTVRNADKRRSTRPPEERAAQPAEAEAPVADPPTETSAEAEATAEPAEAVEPAKVAAPADLSSKASAKEEEVAEPASGPEPEKPAK